MNAPQSASTPFLMEKVDFFAIDSPLLAYAANVASQEGEDGIIERIFQILPPTHQYFVEFGAWDGKFLSNCYHLAANRGWSGCFIEGNRDKYVELLQTHGTNPKVTCVNSFVTLDGAGRLDSILESVGAPKEIGLLSIDIDGMDYFVWESIERFSPTVVVIEFNPTIANDVVFVQAKDFAVNQGSSLLAMITLGWEKGYELICATRWNAFFVKKADYPAFNLSTNFIGRMYTPMMDGRIFHGFDSHVHVLGMPSLAWSRVPVSSEDFQVLPASLRHFSDGQGVGAA